MKTQIWAHRGASAYAPENTLEAFSLANEMHADGIELDVHLSRDGQLIVAHDDTVDRCSNGSGKIHDFTLAQLRELDFSNNKPNYKDVRVPTLAQVYELVKPTNMVINVEIKSGTVLYDGIEQALATLTKDMDMEERVFYSSFNHYSLMQLKALNPAAPIAPLYSSAMYEPWHYARQMGAQAIHPYYPSLQAPGLVAGCKEAGVLINPWTVDGEKEIAWLLSLGVNAIITNVPDVAYRLRTAQ